MAGVTVYIYVSEADSLAGPRILQGLTVEGEQSHLFFPPYRAPLELVPTELCYHLSYSLGGSSYVLVPNGQGRIDGGQRYSQRNDAVADRCRKLAHQRLSLWIRSYPRALLALSHPGNVYPRWGYGVMDFLLKEGPDWKIFRPENLGGFPYYLEWCVRTSPKRYLAYEKYIKQPPNWYLELFPKPPKRKEYKGDRRWNPYHLPAPKPLDREVAAALQPDGHELNQ